MKQLRVAMIAPPWLPIPPDGYGGIENVINGLVPHLRRKGVFVELFTTGDSTIKADKIHTLYKTGQYQYIHQPYYFASPIPMAHILNALAYIKKDGRFDIIHDHNVLFGPLVYSYADRDLPPMVHTLHGPPFSTTENINAGVPDNRLMWREAGRAKRTFFVGISRSMMTNAPHAMRATTLAPIHNAVDPEDFPYIDRKQDYFITLGRFHPDKGQALAVKICQELNLRLKMAGVVGDLSTPRQVMLQLANPLSQYRGLADFRYFSDNIFPHLQEGQIEYVGEVSGQHKLDFISKAKALLFPISWEEPFGMVVIEALACGTPVVSMARGAVPEIIQHGKNGFLARTPAEFKKYVKRIDEIDPAVCRASVEAYFSSDAMAQKYIEHYHEAIRRSKLKS